MVVVRPAETEYLLTVAHVRVENTGIGESRDGSIDRSEAGRAPPPSKLVVEVLRRDEAVLPTEGCEDRSPLLGYA